MVEHSGTPERYESESRPLTNSKSAKAVRCALKIQFMGNSNLKLFNDTLRGENTQKYLADVLGEKKGAFVNNLVALVGNNAQLQACAPTELLYAALKATSLDLPFDGNLGFAYIIPYLNRKEGVTHAQFQLGYKGFIQLAERSGQFKTLNVRDVREGELIGEDFITGELQFKMAARDAREQLPVIGYVAYMRLVNGFEKMLYMTVAELQKHASTYSQTYRSEYTKANSKWATDFDAMAKKTVLKLLLSKYAPMSIQMQQMQTALAADQSVVTATGYDYVDNQEPIGEDAAAAEARAAEKAAELTAKIEKNKQRIKAAQKKRKDLEEMKKQTEGVPEDELGGGQCPQADEEEDVTIFAD